MGLGWIVNDDDFWLPSQVLLGGEGEGGFCLGPGLKGKEVCDVWERQAQRESAQFYLPSLGKVGTVLSFFSASPFSGSFLFDIWLQLLLYCSCCCCCCCSAGGLLPRAERANGDCMHVRLNA